MGKIILKNIRVHTNHGCLEEEELIGSDYVVNLTVWTKLETSSISDDLKDTTDYVSLNRIVKKEMKKRSKLLEQVGARILDGIFFKHKNIRKARVEVAKINPPIGGDVESVSIILKRTKNSK